MTALLALAGCVLAGATIAAVRARWRAAVTWLVAPLAIGGTLASLAAARPASIPSERFITAAVIQGGPVAHSGGPAQDRGVLEAHARETQALASAEYSIDLMIWPESASDIDPAADPQAAAVISSVVRQTNAELLIGTTSSPRADPLGPRNLVTLWTPEDGPTQEYAKRRLVPFGEYLPARSLLEPLSDRFGDVPRDLQPGRQPGVFQTSSGNVGVLTCFEVAFDPDLRELIERGSDVIAVPTNNATYSGSAQPAQQLAMARMRAVESDRWVLVAATTGISAIIRPDGELAAQVPDGEAGALVASVATRETRTFAMQYGGMLAAALSLMGLVSVVAGFAVGRNRHRTANDLDGVRHVVRPTRR